MKRIFLNFIIVIGIALFGFSLSASADYIACGNSAGNDGYYEACIGDTITHYPSGIAATLRSYNGSYVDLRLTGATVSNIRVYKNQSKIAASPDGYDEVNFKYNLRQSNGVTIEVSSHTRACGNSADNDGHFSACAGDKITHYPSNIIIFVKSYSSNYVDLRLTNANISNIRLYKDQPKTITTRDGDMKVTFEYDLQESIAPNRVMIQIDSEAFSEVCDNSAGDDGVYIVCKNDVITHYLSGITATVRSYNNRYINLRLTGAKKSILRVYKNQSRTITSSDEATQVTFTYDYKDANGVAIKIDSVELSPCINYKGNDGFYNLCIGNRVKHSSSGITATLTSYNSRYANLRLTGARSSIIRVYKNQPKAVISGDDKTEVTFIYDSKEASGVLIQIESRLMFSASNFSGGGGSSRAKPSSSCSSFTGSDGSYYLCRRKKITHSPSDITATLSSYNNSYLNLRLTGAKKSRIRIYKNKSRTATSKNGNVKVRFTYDSKKAKGVMLEVSTYSQSKYHFYGYVLDEYSNPISNARVDIAVNGTGKIVKQVFTNSRGYFSFPRFSLNRSKEYFIAVYDTDNNTDRNMSSYGSILDLNEYNREFDIRLFYPHKIDFDYRYNPSGSRYFNSNKIENGRGSVFTHKKNGSLAGFDFISGDVDFIDGAFYVGSGDNNIVKIWANNSGQGGVIDLGRNTSIYNVRSAPREGYNMQGIELKQGHNYAIYDEDDDIYAVIYIRSIRVDR